MRTLILCPLLFLPAFCHPQWTTYETGSYSNLQTADAAGQVVLVGGDNVIFRSTDGGLSWNFVLTLDQPTQGWGFHDVRFADASTVYCVGAERAFKSTDAGATWNELNIPTSSAMWSVAAPSPSTAYIGCVSATVMRTTNGGTSFNSVNLPGGGPQTSWSLHFTSNTTGFSATGTKIYRTENSGSYWTEVNYGLGLGAIHFPDAMHGCVVGNGGRISTTSDGGNTWTTRVSGITGDLRAVHFADVMNGMAVGWSGSIVRTTDGGVTWFNEPLPAFDQFESVVMLDPTTVIIGGQFGTIYRGSLSVGIHENAQPSLLSLSPNPTKDIAMLTLPGEHDGSSVEVTLFDQLGRQALQMRANAGGGGIYLDLSELQPGEYHGVVLSNRSVLGRVRLVRIP